MPDMDEISNNAMALARSYLAEQQARIVELEQALRDLDECYCQLGEEMSRRERDHHRQVLIRVRAVLARAKP